MPRPVKSIIVHLKVQTRDLVQTGIFQEYKSATQNHNEGTLQPSGNPFQGTGLNAFESKQQIHFEPYDTGFSSIAPEDHELGTMTVKTMGGLRIIEPIPKQSSTTSSSSNVPSKTTIGNQFQYEEDVELSPTSHSQSHSQSQVSSISHRPRQFVEPCSQEYMDMSIYPRKTMMSCWWDGHFFSGKPILIPKSASRDGSYVVYGNFCSPECAKAYLENEVGLDPEIRWERCMLLHHMCHKIFSNTLERIKTALPRITLKEYGGTFTIDEYRQFNSMPSKQCEMVYPPITTEIPFLEVRTQEVPQIPKKSFVSIQKERFEKAEENLRIRETGKPAKTTPLTKFMTIEFMDEA
jgi:hypothetical protein